MHANCLWVAIAPHLSFLFLVFMFVISCISVLFVMGIWIGSVFLLVWLGVCGGISWWRVGGGIKTVFACFRASLIVGGESSNLCLKCVGEMMVLLWFCI